MAERRENRFPEPQKKSSRQTGTDYERAAGYYLEQLGYEILEYNYRCRAGEIDLIAKDGEYLVFCEVKLFYLTEHHMGNVPCRFDVVGIEGTEVVHIKNAFAG